MRSKFVALPVGQGDAFYLERNGHYILVDGGRAIRAFPRMLMTYVNPPHLDVVACTHNDADHANGIVGLLEDLPVPIREVWLPGTWAWRFEDLVTMPLKFFHEMWRDIYEAGEEVGPLGRYYQQNWERLRTNVETQADVRPTDHSTDVTEWLVDVFERQDVYFWSPWLEYRGLFEMPYQIFEGLWLECLGAARRIMSIAKAAIDIGARIRLFEFVQSPEMASGGWRGELEPVNSREVWPHRQPVSALAYLALTEANRESLVFYAPEQARNIPSVLFTADSDLACGLTHVHSPSANLVVTAPHHGSEANASVYTVVDTWITADRTIWVRSDSRSKRRPGKTFKRQSRRLCTLCNSGKASKAPVRLHAVQSYWRRTRGTQWCSCV